MLLFVFFNVGRQFGGFRPYLTNPFHLAAHSRACPAKDREELDLKQPVS